MLAVMGAWFQHFYTGTDPIDNLFDHPDTGYATIFTGGLKASHYGYDSLKLYPFENKIFIYVLYGDNIHTI